MRGKGPGRCSCCRRVATVRAKRPQYSPCATTNFRQSSFPGAGPHLRCGHEVLKDRPEVPPAVTAAAAAPGPAIKVRQPDAVSVRQGKKRRGCEAGLPQAAPRQRCI
jgi:hypothetical protein